MDVEPEVETCTATASTAPKATTAPTRRSIGDGDRVLVGDRFDDEGVVPRRGGVRLDVVAHSPGAAADRGCAQERASLRLVWAGVGVGADDLAIEGADADGVGQAPHGLRVQTRPRNTSWLGESEYHG